MVIGWSQQEQQSNDASHTATSPWALVETAQRRLRLPCLLIPQPAHAVLAGDIAAELTCFGEIPPEIKRAIQMHDTGWASSDAQQIQRLRSPNAGAKALPVSFIGVSPGEAEEAWLASIDAVGAFSPAGAVVISRHFCLLAEHDPSHRRFLEARKARRASDSAVANEADLDRWTAALGFCDLLSLYLLTGFSKEVEFPLAHPASAQAQTAPRLKMQIQGTQLRFTPAAIRAGCTLSIHALRHPLPAQGARAEMLTWQVQ